MFSRNKPIFVAITGGIACGKTLAGKFFKNHGYPVYSTDKIGHDLLNDKTVIEKLKKIFGKDIVINNKIDRKKLGNIVFADKEKLTALNSILHPLIEKKIEQIKKNEKNRIVFFEVPLLFEVGKQNDYDYTICVYANEDVQKKRLIKRNFLTLSQAQLRIKSQMPLSEKIEKSDFAVENNDDLESFLRNLNEVLRKLEKKLK